jgi:hypothetical protein
MSAQSDRPGKEQSFEQGHTGGIAVRTSSNKIEKSQNPDSVSPQHINIGSIFDKNRVNPGDRHDRGGSQLPVKK